MEQDLILSPLFWWGLVQSVLASAGGYFLAHKAAQYALIQTRRRKYKDCLALFEQAESHANCMYQASVIENDFELDMERQLLVRAIRSASGKLPPGVDSIVRDLHDILVKLPRDLDVVESYQVYVTVCLLRQTLTEYTQNRKFDQIRASLRLVRGSLDLLETQLTKGSTALLGTL